MEPTPIDLTSSTEDMYRRVHALRLACHDADAPGEPFLSLPVWRNIVRTPPPRLRRFSWLLSESHTEDEGYAELAWPVGSPRAFTIVNVAPPARRRGLGSALLAAVTAHARTLGCTHLTARFGGPPGAAFAARHRAVAGNSQISAVCPLPPQATIKPISGYAVRSWLNVAPEELLRSYAYARNAIFDAPRTGGLDEPPWTPQRVRGFEATLAARGREQRVTVALADGEVAAFTEVRVAPETGAVAAIEESAVVAAHRGRGLATWLKSLSLQALYADRPDVPAITTLNDALNTPILAVNRRLGFVPVARWTDAVLAL